MVLRRSQVAPPPGDSPEDPIPIAIEIPRGLRVAALRASGRPVSAINPMAVPLPGNRVFAKQRDIALNPSRAEHPKGQHD
jgi:hypothetical protein